MKPQNLHTHTNYCDGKHTPAEMAASALRQGCGSLGFSGHSFLDFDPGWTMQQSDLPRYRQEILALREQYAGRMEIFLGLEQDYYSEKPEAAQWDYLIGSVHCLEKNGAFFSVDNTPEKLEQAIEQLYDGDSLALAEDYYHLVFDLYQKTGCQIIGHLDLLTKFNEDDSLFRTDHPRYRRAALEAVHHLVKQDMIFEVNTGAISRGWRTAPYPEQSLLREICRAGGRVCISSDSHSADTVLFGFRDAMLLAQHCGFREVARLTPSGFRQVSLEELLKCFP